MIIEIRVIGVPYPQGSKSAFVRGGRAVLAEGSSLKGRAGHAAWRQAVATATRDWLGENPRSVISEPVTVGMDFFFPSVASDPYRTRHTTKPDLDKIIRSVFDALVDGGLLKDDAIVYNLVATKRYATDHPPGCLITLTTAGEDEHNDRQTMKLAAKEKRQSEARTRSI